MLTVAAMTAVMSMMPRCGVIGFGNRIASSMAEFTIGRVQLVAINCSGFGREADCKQAYQSGENERIFHDLLR